MASNSLQPVQAGKVRPCAQGASTGMAARACSSHSPGPRRSREAATQASAAVDARPTIVRGGFRDKACEQLRFTQMPTGCSSGLAPALCPLPAQLLAPHGTRSSPLAAVFFYICIHGQYKTCKWELSRTTNAAITPRHCAFAIPCRLGTAEPCLPASWLLPLQLEAAACNAALRKVSSSPCLVAICSRGQGARPSQACMSERGGVSSMWGALISWGAKLQSGGSAL